jgi:hypothetical protein
MNYIYDKILQILIYTLELLFTSRFLAACQSDQLYVNRIIMQRKFNYVKIHITIHVNIHKHSSH